VSSNSADRNPSPADSVGDVEVSPSVLREAIRVATEPAAEPASNARDAGADPFQISGLSTLGEDADNSAPPGADQAAPADVQASEDPDSEAVVDVSPSVLRDAIQAATSGDVEVDPPAGDPVDHPVEVAEDDVFRISGLSAIGEAAEPNVTKPGRPNGGRPAPPPAGGGDFQPGDHIAGGRYLLAECLGRGGMGAVFRATDTVLEVERALKFLVLRDEFTAEERDQLRTRMLQECRAAQELAARTRGVVQIYDVGFEDGTPYLVMELLCGEDLHTRLKRETRLPLDESLRVVRDAARALGVGHRRGILHRDIKPGNIWLEAPQDVPEDTPPTVKILDFGLVKHTRDDRQLTDALCAVGTPQYMSMEQYLGGGKIDARTDVFALGAVLYECLVGRRALSGDTQDRLADQYNDELATFPEDGPGLPDGVTGLIDRCLARARKRRPPDGDALADELDALLQAIGAGELATAERDEAASKSGAPADEPDDDAPSSSEPSSSPALMPEPQGAASHRPTPVQLPAVSAASVAEVSAPSDERQASTAAFEDTRPESRQPALAMESAPPDPKRRLALVVAVAAVLALALWWAFLRDADTPVPEPVAATPAPMPEVRFERAKRGAVTDEEVAAALAKPPKPAQPQGPAVPEPTAEPEDEDAPPEAKPQTKKPQTKKKRARKPSRRPTNAELDREILDRYAQTRTGTGAAPPAYGAAAGYTGTARPAPHEGGRRFFAPGGTMKVPGKEPAKPTRIELPAGTTFAARLKVGVSSSQRAVVLATATVPKGAILRGRASSDHQRVFIDFTSVTTGGKSHPIKAYAITGGRPGLAARRREATPDERGGAAVARGALNTAAGVAGALGGDVARDLARNVGSETAREARRDTEVDRRYTLEVDAGTSFQIVVTGG
jgi:serine/threonine protein kinase